MSFGNSLHAALEELHNPSRTGADISLETLLRKHWRSDGYTTPDQDAAHYTKALDAFTRYCVALTPPGGQILATEGYLTRIITHDAHRFELSCRADRIELRPGGTLEVLDYKTNGDGNVPPSEQLALDLPTFIYYLLARLSSPRYAHIVVSQLNLLSLRKVAVDYTDEQHAQNKTGLLGGVAKIETGNFGPRPGPHCAWCPVKARCPAFAVEITLDNI